ncbi:hypothetical protein F7725_004143 [Dissostichus mawsoni]|uniref:Uncharacterized protein n=1 Tax=Dissostichus mawsoni TaxID=36200 RepID=A0A7J5YCC1_DISMA|nr:hypothetical protein F7725_004143 [Dissostichus mawsoni]
MQVEGAGLIVLIDGLNEAEFHRPDYGDTLTSFLSRHIQKFPSWLKVVTTVRTGQQVDQQQPVLIRYCCRGSTAVQRSRATSEPGLLPVPEADPGPDPGGFLVLKSSSFKVVPVSLAEVYLLQLNMRFPTQSSFQRVQPLLNVAVSSLHPLTDQQVLFEVVNASAVSGGLLSWGEFVQRMEQLNSFLLRRSDGSRMLNHSSFREWLMSGHTLLAFWLCRRGGKLTRAVDVLQHGGSEPRPFISEKPVHPQHQGEPAAGDGGADVDSRSDVLNSAPLLCVHAHLGHSDAVALLLDLGAQVDTQSHDGLTALGFAAAAGHMEIVTMLTLTAAAGSGRLSVCRMLLDQGAGMRPLDRAVGCRNTSAVIALLRKGAKIGPATWAMATSKPDIMMVLLSN